MLHCGSHLLSKGVTVAWGLTPFSEGVGHCGPDCDISTRDVLRNFEAEEDQSSS